MKKMNSYNRTADAVMSYYGWRTQKQTTTVGT